MISDYKESYGSRTKEAETFFSLFPNTKDKMVQIFFWASTDKYFDNMFMLFLWKNNVLQLLNVSFLKILTYMRDQQ